MASVEQYPDTPLPPTSLSDITLDQIFSPASIKKIDFLKRKFVGATRTFQQAKENEVMKMKMIRSTHIRERLAEALGMERNLIEETAAEEANLELEEALRIAELCKTDEFRARLAQAVNRNANHVTLTEGWEKKLNTNTMGMGNKSKVDEIRKNLSLQVLDEKAMQFVVEPNTDKIVSIKFWNIDANQPKAECAIFFKSFDVADLSLFEVNTVAPMFPEFEEVSRKATETKNLMQLIIDCVRCWKNICGPERND